jgi:hypothetical protein
MALPARPMHVPAGLAIDQSTRKELLDVGKANVLNVNARSDHRGGLTKRLGFTSLALTRFDATSRSAGNRLGCHRNVVWTIDGTYLDTYASTPARSVVASRVPEVSTTAMQLTNSWGTLLGVATAGGYVASAVVDGLDVNVTVSTTNGEAVRRPEVLFTSTDVFVPGAVCAYSTYLIVIASDSSTANIKAWYLDTTSAATVTTGWVAIGNIATDKTTGSSDSSLSAESLTNRIAFAYVNNSGGASQLTVKTFTIAGVAETATVNTSSVTPDAVCVEGSIADTLWVAWNETTTIKIQGRDADVLATTLATTGSIGNVISSVGAGQIYLLSKSTAGKGMLAFNDSSGDMCLRGFQTSAGVCATDGVQSSVNGAFMRARPFRLSDRYYSLFNAITGGTLVLCDWTDTITPATAWLRPVSQMVPSLTQATSLTGSMGAAVALSATKYGYPAFVQRSSAGYSLTLFSFDFADRKRWRSVSHNGSLYFAGGILSYFDGSRVSEAAYMHAPKTPSAVDSGGGTGPNGTYKYVLTYEEVDDDGNWCPSSVSSPSNTLTITDNTATVTCAPLVITGRLLPGVSGAIAVHKKRMRVCLYRTATGAEAPYYLVETKDNDTLSVVTFSDSTADSTLTSNRLLYGTGNLPGTNGSAQDRRCPPFCQDLESYAGMLVVASGSSLWWSGQAVDGEGVWFSPAFQQPVDGDDDITAIRAQDGTLYVFKRRSIFAVAGEAPSDNGAAGGLGVPRKLAVDVGCIDSSSIVVTSYGIFFQSERGIELLGRGGAVQYIGEQVQDTLESYPVVSSAVLDDRNGLVRFSLAAAESGGRVSGNGRTVVFDLTLQGWISVDDVRGAGASEAAQDAAMVYVGGYWRYGWLGANGTVYYERLSSDGSAHLDVASFVTMQLELPPWKLGLQQEQRIYEIETLFERHSAAGLTIECAKDYGSYDGALDKVWAEAATVSQRQVPFRPPPRCTAVQLRVKDTAPAVLGTGKGFTFIGLSADIAPKQGPTRGTTRLNPDLRR